MMSNALFRIRGFLWHLLTAFRNNKGFGVQSPFAYHLLNDAIHCKHSYYAFNALLKEKNTLLRERREIEIEDYGSKGYRRIKRGVCEVAFHSVKSTKQQEMIFRLVNFMQPETILELGTSLGLTSAYMSLARPKAQIVTIEACHACAKEAVELWKRLNLTNITLVEDTFENKLKSVLDRMKKVDFVFIDGNHTGEALNRYFNLIISYCTKNCMMIVDDICWSKDMNESWKQIKQHPSVRVTFDLFHMGIMLLNSDVTPGNYKAIVV